MGASWGRWVLISATAVMSSGQAMADTALPVPDMSLEDLVNTEITSASRKSQNQQHVAAAVFVITQEDIARSGARNLADVLAMAPGIEVARLGNGRWAVSARGFNGRFANKLQVLKDGRSVYSPLFSGVAWEAEDMVLEDIERIEIFRGPNAVAWGSNAVNGTINIITRKARDTQGGLIAVEAGSEDRANVTARYGFALGDRGSMRIYGKGVDRRSGDAPGGGRAHDESDFGMAGFRADFLAEPGQRVMLSGDVYRQHGDDVYQFADPQRPPSYVNTFSSRLHLHGAHLQGRLDALQDDGSEISLQAYFNQTEVNAESAARERRRTVDLDAQYRFAPLGRHDLIVGVNLRHSRDRITTSSPYLSFPQGERDFRLASLFFNDEITLVPDKFRVTVGARLENNNFSGTAFQPTARFLWTPDAQQTVWGALSGATRTPSRADMDARIVVAVVPPGPQPFPIQAIYQGDGGGRVKAERMEAAELGYRRRFNPNYSFDATAFVHRYRDGISMVTGSLDLSTVFTQGYAQQFVTTVNGQHTRIQGLEFAAFAQITPTWRLQPSYTWQYAVAEGLGDISSEALAQRDEDRVPRHLFSLRSQHNLGNSQQLDFWFKYKSRIEAFSIPGRANLDIRYAWKLDRNLELSVVGQNLLHERVLEYVPDYLPSALVKIARGGYVRLEHRF